MTIATGTFLGPYEILGLVGSGGMGEVYKARDRRLGRHVAIKILPIKKSVDRDRLMRFEREARLASSLNHPNIVTIYDIGEENSIPYIAMELVEGQTLREALNSGPVSLRRIVSIALQVADALAKAHESGIVHRDLKPENLMVTPDGVVKILDFGLGKNEPLPIAPSESTIMAAPDSTNPGTILGTVDYMSPEQAAGRDTDYRSDQFSLGSIIYEMTANRRAFRRETAVQTMSAIIGEAPAPLSASTSGVPGPLRDIVERCLQKKPDQRYTSTRELMTQLRELSAVLEVSSASLSKVVSTVSAERLKRPAWPAIRRVLAIGLVALAVALGLKFIRWSEPLPTSKNLVVLPFQSADDNPDSRQFAAGLTEAITTALTQLTTDPSLQMSPASEVATRRVATADDAKSLLAANLVLTGRVEKTSERLQVSWTVEDTADHRQLRTRTISVDASEPLELESRTLESVVDALELQLTPAVEALLARDTRIPAARDAYLRGRGYLQEFDKPENIARAIALFEEAARLDPNYAQAYAGLGEALWWQYDRTHARGSIDWARENCQKAISLNEKLAASHGCLGAVHFAVGNYEEAVKEFRRAIQIEPTNDNFWRDAARAEERLGRFDSAEKTLKEAVQLRPQYWANYNLLGIFYFNRGKNEEAVGMFSQVIKLAPDTTLGYANLGAAWIKLAKYDAAIGMFQRSISIRPTRAAYSNLATTYFQKRRFLEAGDTFEKAVKLDDKNYVWWGNLADAYYWAAGKRSQAPEAYRKAIALGEEALKVNERDAAVLGRLAQYHAMIGEKDKALSYLNRALQVAPDDQEVRFKAALVHNQFKQQSQTLEWLEKAAQAGYSITTIRDVPNFDHLWLQGRFQDLLRKY